MGSDDESDDDLDIVFVDETQARRDKQSAALQGRKQQQQLRVPVSSKVAQKKRGGGVPAPQATITPAKRGRPAMRKKAHMSSPVTPSPLSTAVSTPATIRNSADPDADDVDDPNETTMDRRKKQRSKVWDHFTLMTEHGDGYGLFKCHGCEEDQISARLNSTSNLWTHARQSCPKVHALITGIKVDATQARLDGINAVIQPFTKARLHHKVVEWIASSGLPFTTVESSALREIFKFLHQKAILPSADTVSRHLEQLYETTEEMVDNLLRENASVLHYAHDAWTDPAHRNCFFGIYASFIDEKFEYREVLLRLVHLRGKHAGFRLGDGLFEIFQKMQIARNVGPGTSDNASNNLTTAERLMERMNGDLMLDMPSTDLMRCMCHVANLAASDYLNAEGQ